MSTSHHRFCGLAAVLLMAVVLMCGNAVPFLLGPALRVPRAPHDGQVSTAGALSLPLQAAESSETSAAAPAMLAAGITALAAISAVAQRRRGDRAARAAVVCHAKKRKGQQEKETNKVAAQGGESEDQMMVSLIGRAEEEDLAEDAEAQEIEEEMEKGQQEPIQSFSEADVPDVELTEESEEELARKGERQIVYNLYPSRKYVRYIATRNAERTWTKDGAEGKNKGCLEVQIAIATERIRAMVMHARENIHDYKCRMKLVSLVARRRRILDKLSWKDLDSYLNIRDALKIRHVYRMEALIGRLPRYRYSIRDRKPAPGRKVAMRLKKTKRLLERRLAAQLRQGKPKDTIHKTKRAIKSRNWYARAYDDVSAMMSGKDGAPPFIDPLNVP